MKLTQKTTLATLLLLSLTACSSGGKSNKTAPIKDVDITLTEQNQKDPKLQKQLSEAQSAKANAEKTIAALQAEKIAANKKVADLQNKLTSAEKALAEKKLNPKVLEQLKTDLAAATKAKNALENRLSSVQKELSETNQALQNVDVQLSNKPSTETEKLLTEKNKALADVKKQLAEKDKSFAETQKLLTEKSKSLANIEKQLAETNKALQNVEVQLTDKPAAETEKLLAEKTKLLKEAEKLIAEKEKAITEQKRIAEGYVKELKDGAGALSYEQKKALELNEKISKVQEYLQTYKQIFDAQTKQKLPLRFPTGKVPVAGTLNKSISLNHDENGFWVEDTYVYLNSKPHDGRYLAVRGSKATVLSTLNDDQKMNKFHNKFWITDWEKENPSLTRNLPSSGSATYKGKAFHLDTLGDFTYQVDFAKKTGEGKVSNFAQNLEWQDITLKPTTFSTATFSGEASQGTATGNYKLSFMDINHENNHKDNAAQFLVGSAFIKGTLPDALPAPHSIVKERYNSDEKGVEFGLFGEKQAAGQAKQK